MRQEASVQHFVDVAEGPEFGAVVARHDEGVVLAQDVGVPSHVREPVPVGPVQVAVARVEGRLVEGVVAPERAVSAAVELVAAGERAVLGVVVAVHVHGEAVEHVAHHGARARPRHARRDQVVVVAAVAVAVAVAHVRPLHLVQVGRVVVDEAVVVVEEAPRDGDAHHALAVGEVGSALDRLRGHGHEHLVRARLLVVGAVHARHVHMPGHAVGHDDAVVVGDGGVELGLGGLGAAAARLRGRLADPLLVEREGVDVELRQGSGRRGRGGGGGGRGGGRGSRTTLVEAVEARLPHSAVALEHHRHVAADGVVVGGAGVPAVLGVLPVVLDRDGVPPALAVLLLLQGEVRARDDDGTPGVEGVDALLVVGIAARVVRADEGAGGPAVVAATRLRRNGG